MELDELTKAFERMQALVFAHTLALQTLMRHLPEVEKKVWALAPAAEDLAMGLRLSDEQVETLRTSLEALCASVRPRPD